MKIIEARIHGRGGQGSVTLAEMIVEAAFAGDWQAQAFPNFGVERRGAPVEAYARLSRKFIRLRSQVYEPDYVIVQDASLLSGTNVYRGIKKGAMVLINTKKSAAELSAPRGVIVKTINAHGLAMEVIGRPIVNTILLGAFAGVSTLIKLSAVEKVIREKLADKGEELVAKNIEAARRGFEVINDN